MDAADLYSIYAEELENEELITPPWDALPPREQMVWKNLARRLPQELAPRQATLSGYPD